MDKMKASTLEMFDATPNPKPQYLPDMMRVMDDIDSGKRTIDDIDWGKELEHTRRFLSITNSNVPSVIWLWGMTVLIHNPKTRIQVIEKLRSLFYSYIDKESSEEFFSACNSLIHINKRVIAFNEKYKGKKGIHYWSDHRKFLNDLAHVVSDDFICAEDLVDVANSMREDYYGADEHEVLTRVLRAFDDKKTFYYDDIVEFCANLFEANHYCRLIDAGFTVEERLRHDGEEYVPWLLRNQCFDLYIERRLKNIEKDLNANHKRLKAADELECYTCLLEQESRNVAKAALTEYDEDDMAVMFLKYLKLKIAELKKPETQNSAQQVIINAPVGQFIANVEHMNTTTDK